MTDILFRRVAAERGWSDAAQLAVLLRYVTRTASLPTMRDFLAHKAAVALVDDPAECFIQDVIAVLRDPGLALDRAFRRYCANSRDLLTPRQAAERWCCWRAA